MSGDRWSTWIGLAGQLVGTILDLIERGASDEEIRARLADPAGVGQKLIDAVRARRSKLDDFIKRG